MKLCGSVLNLCVRRKRCVRRRGRAGPPLEAAFASGASAIIPSSPDTILILTESDTCRKLTDEEVPRRKTQYSAQSGRIIPASSWGGKKRSSRTSHKRAQRWQTQTLEGVELKVLELLCQILQTDSLSMVQQWLLLASEKEKELVQGLLQKAMVDSSSLTQQTSGSELLPLTSEDLPDHVFLSSSVSRRKSSSHPAEPLQDKPERIGEAEVLTLYPENT
ncbi:hypothetical protein cypCar_00021038 [Cyprinus carpio]|nr:hypothetical protein cypCar_00021038 [Cyprinus carpio]